jgi:signal transduction histidine kinase
MLDEIICLLVQIKGVAENIAHDLRTPLAMVRARLERGLADSDDRELRLAAAKALGQLDKAMITVAALLRIAEVESGPRPVGFAPIDLAAICADLFEFYEPLAREKSISTTLEAQSPVETIGDGDLMRGALSNLIDNAIKFTPGGGAHIGDDGRRLSGYSRQRQRGWREPAGRDKIFERFHRVSRDDGVAGAGIDLNLAAAIASLHDFDLRVKGHHPGAEGSSCRRINQIGLCKMCARVLDRQSERERPLQDQ